MHIQFILSSALVSFVLRFGGSGLDEAQGSECERAGCACDVAFVSATD